MIEEASLYANLSVETSPVQTTASWTNHIATVRDISLSRGGVEDFIGINNVEPGSGTITLVGNTATINPGHWVRIRYSTTIIWAGYVQDVVKNYTLINGEVYEVKTLTCLDWVAWVAQYTVSNIPRENKIEDRARDINDQITGTPVQPSTHTGSGPFQNLDQIVETRSVADVLDLTSNSYPDGWWRSQLVSPLGSAVTNLIRLGRGTTLLSVALTDGTHTGTPSGLTEYTDIEVATRTSQVVNNVIVQNIHAIDDQEVVTEFQKTDATSEATYGSRLATTQANGEISIAARNLFPYPSFEEYLNRYEDTNFFYSAEKPALDSGGAWSAWNGSEAYRAFAKTTAVPTVALPLSEVVPVTAGVTYYGFAYGASSAGLQSRARFFIQWQNDSQGIISTTYGAYVNHAALRTWYQTSGSATAPAGAVWARVGLQFSRTTGANIGANSKYWTDGLYFGTTNETTWFDGNTPDTTSNIYNWIGQPNASESFRAPNAINTLATQFLTDNATAKYSPSKVRLNAQANLTAVQLFNLYEAIHIWFQSNRWTSVITGITHNININPDGTTRWMIDLDIRPSTATI